MEKLLIITEKPSAGRNFAAALGGSTGTFEGNPYTIVSLRGHILTHETPEKVAYPNHAETVGGFANIENLPWSYTYFDFDKRVVPKKIRDFAIPVIENMKTYIQDGYIPVIASDIDAMGEGDLLVQEVLTFIGYEGKIYREYHVDETPKAILKSMREKKDVTHKNDGLTAGTTRMVLDFLTQQLVRTATVTIQNQGYKLPRPVPVGRLQSTMMKFVGDQIKAIDEYKPSSVFESRYNLDDIVFLTNPDVEQFKTKEEWHADGLPTESGVREVRQVPGITAPPKALTLTGLASLMSRKGIRSKQTNELAQAMYDKGVLSYPRTEDNFITPEQFEEILPNVDTILNLLGLATSVFTHRTPRKTHVKEGGSHGALRPGVNIPNTLEELNISFGPGASVVYKAVAERFVMMFLENTEWVRHEYETTDTPVPFKGSVRVITKKGVVDPEEDTKDVVTLLPNLQHKAVLFPYELKSIKPKAPTESWLLDQLKKHNVGTAATQVSTIGRLIGANANFPLIATAKTSDPLALSPIGSVGYIVAQNISLGTPEATRKYEDMIKQIIKGETTQPQIYESFTQTIKDDVNKIKGLTFDLSNLGFQMSVKRVKGIWQGQEVFIPESVNGYTFTEQELQQLFTGDAVTFTGKDYHGNPVQKTVKLGYTTYKGKQYVGYIDSDYYYGVFDGAEIRFKKQYMTHTFSDDECEALLQGQTLHINVTDSDGNNMNLSGKLEKQKTGSGVTFYGFRGVFPLRDGYVEGVFKGQTVRFKGSFSNHTFTNQEIERLLAGETIVIEYKDGKQCDGKLTWQQYQGKKFLGFKANFGQNK